MPIRLACPQCRKPLQVDDRYAGQRVQCPGCRAMVTAPVANKVQVPIAQAPEVPSADTFDFYGSPNPAAEAGQNRLRGPAADGWRNVIAGLNLIWLGSGIQVLAVTVVLLVTSVLFGAGADFLSRAGEGDTALVSRPTASAAAELIKDLIVLSALAAGTVVRLVGFFRCLGTPPESGARGLALPMLLAEILLLGSTAIILAGDFLRLVLVVLGGYLALIVAFLAGLVLQLLFVHQLGKALNSRALPPKLRNFLFWLVGGFLASVLVVAGYVALIFFGLGVFCMATLVVIAVVVGSALTALIKYLGLLTLASDEIRKRLKAST
jgi:hypothetical protein